MTPPPVAEPVADLVRRLLRMGEPIAFGSDADALEEAAEALSAETAARVKAEGELLQKTQQLEAAKTRLLETVPGWQSRIGEMAAVSPYWMALVNHWGELLALYRQPGEHTGSALYTRMRQILDPIEFSR